MLAKRLFGTALLGALVALPVTFAGCGDELCCTEFEAGGTVDVNISADVKAQVAAQAVADLSGTANAMIEDLTTACRNIATDLDAPQADRDAAEALEDRNERMSAYCSLAVKTIGTVKGSATLKVTFDEPKCSVDVAVSANCDAKCSVSGECDVKANPPTCEGGKMTVSCEGKCEATAEAPSISCTGSCGGTCEGSCTAEAGVECNGKCDGTCEASTQGNGDGIQADGTCKGSCKGTCDVTVGGSCEGTCSGSCTGSCEAAPGQASFQCDGSCDAVVEPLKCEGGELKATCDVDADCSANCSASASAKASCTPPKLAFEFGGGIEATAIAKLRGTLEANLGAVINMSARFKALGNIAANVSGNIEGFTELKLVCIPVLAEAAADSVKQIQVSATASASLLASVGG